MLSIWITKASSDYAYLSVTDVILCNLTDLQLFCFYRNAITKNTFCPFSSIVFIQNHPKANIQPLRSEWQWPIFSSNLHWFKRCKLFQENNATSARAVAHRFTKRAYWAKLDLMPQNSVDQSVLCCTIFFSTKFFQNVSFFFFFF